MTRPETLCAICLKPIPWTPTYTYQDLIAIDLIHNKENANVWFDDRKNNHHPNEKRWPNLTVPTHRNCNYMIAAMFNNRLTPQARAYFRSNQ